MQKAFPQVITEEFGVGIITRCGNPTFGDFQCNNSLSIAKYFKTLSGFTGKKYLFLCFLLDLEPYNCGDELKLDYLSVISSNESIPKIMDYITKVTYQQL